MAAARMIGCFATRCMSVLLPLAPIPAYALPNDAAAPVAAWPASIWMRVPSPPMPFPSEGGQHLYYELYLTNLAQSASSLTSVEVFDPDHAERPMARFTGEQLAEIAQPLGHDMPTNDENQPVVLDPGQTVALFLEVTIPDGQRVPNRLAERMIYADGTAVEGGAIDVSRAPLKTLRAPVGEGDWIAGDGPSNSRTNHHRRGIFVVDGMLMDSRRFAIDWKKVRDGSTFAGDRDVDASYYSYREPVFAVADAIVVGMRDGAPDNPPGHNERFRPAVPVTFANAGGNTIVLDLGDGQYAHYFHLEAGSISVKRGDRVRRGQMIARIGASGDAREPHLHFEVTTAIALLRGEGLPYTIDRYRVAGGNGYRTGSRDGTLPLDGMIVSFP
jgi:hypothetical protein